MRALLFILTYSSSIASDPQQRVSGPSPPPPPGSATPLPLRQIWQLGRGSTAQQLRRSDSWRRLKTQARSPTEPIMELRVSKKNIHMTGMSVIRAAMPFQVCAETVVAMGRTIDGLRATWNCRRCYCLVSEVTVNQRCTVPGDWYHPGDYMPNAGWSCCNANRKRYGGCVKHGDEVTASHTGRP